MFRHFTYNLGVFKKGKKRERDLTSIAGKSIQ